MAAERVERTGLRVAERRKELGLTQHQLAERLPEASIDGQRISKWERGINSPSPDNLEALALALETDVADLVSGPTGERGETPDLPGGSQLDRIEQRLDRVEEKVDRLLDAVATPSTVDAAELRAALEAAAQRADEGREKPPAARRRKGRKGRAA